MKVKDLLGRFETYVGQNLIIELFTQFGIYIATAEINDYDYTFDKQLEKEIDVFFIDYDKNENLFKVKIWIKGV